MIRLRDVSHNLHKIVNAVIAASGKKIQSALIAVIALTMPVASFTVGNITGDLAPRGNPDGVLNAADVLILQQIVSGQIIPTAAETLSGDVAPLGNPDGQLNAGDLVVLQRAVLGTVNLPPTADTLPPPQADTSLISISNPTAGHIQVTGATGSVEGNSTVSLVNFETGSTTSVVANASGSFSVDLIANAGEVFSVVVKDAAGNASPSASVGVGQILSLNITSPTNGITLNEDRSR